MASEIAIMFELLKRTGNIYLGVLLGLIWIKSPLQIYRKQFVQVTINIFTPFLIIISLLREYGSNWLFPMIAAILVTVLGLIIPSLLAKIHKQKPPEPAEICTASFSNALNFPFPVIVAFAPEALGAAGIFLAMAIVLRNTVGLWISGIKLSRESVRNILTFAPIWGIIIGLVVRVFFSSSMKNVINLPIVDILFQIGIFMTIMTIGFSLQKPNLDYKYQLYRVGVTRFIVSSLVSVTFVLIFRLPEIVAIPIIVQMMSPPAVYNGLYAEKFNLNTELTSQIIVTLTLVALIILPFELLILQLLF